MTDSQDLIREERTGGWLRGRVAAPIISDGATLAINLITGVLVARLLGPEGRGEIAATLTIAQMFGWLFSIGVSEAGSYHLARRPEDSGRFLTTWLVILIPVAIVGVVLAELLLPILFEAQTDQAYSYARLYLLMIGGYVVLELAYGALAGTHDFFAFNGLRLLQPAAIACGYVAFWAIGDFSVATALEVNAVALALTVLLGLFRVSTHGRVERPSRALASETAAFGLRAHLSAAGGFLVARMDLMIIPAFLAASAVGLYSVATNVGSMLLTLTGALGALVLPAAARERGEAVGTVLRAARLALLISLTLAVPLGVLAAWALELVYGEDFGGAATALRILLPGFVFGSVGAIVRSGLLAAGRPLVAAATNVLGLAVTVVGLLVVLPDGGIEGTAVVSTLSFATAAIAGVFMFKRVEELSWRQLVTPAPRER